MHKIILLSLFAVAGLFAGQQTVFAQEVAEQPCDPQVYRQMSSRAWLESEREIMQNQNLIFKADSVFEYTCFDQFLSKAAWEGGDIFTHTDYFDGAIIERGGGDAVETAMDNVVFASLETYWGNNFGHSLLGGRGEFVGLDAAPGTEMNSPTSQLDYTCGIMTTVWAKAKCLNFVHNDEFVNNDSFYPFETIVAEEGGSDVEGYDVITDTRQYPIGMECDNESDLTSWDLELENAENEGELLYAFQTPLGAVFEDVAFRTLPGECTDAIGTGVTVVLSDGPAHLDGLCTNPGCTYTAGGTGALGTCN